MVVLTGKVVSDYEYSHETYGEKFFNLKLEVTRQSNNKDIINLIVSDRMIYDLEGKFIGVTGTLRSYNVGNGSVKLGVLVDTIDVFEDEPGEDVNCIDMEGYICKKSKVRKTDSGRKICNILLAVQRPYGKSDYIPCIVWNRNASYVSNLELGTRIFVSGRLQSRDYIKDNVEKTTYEVSIQEIS